MTPMPYVPSMLIRWSAAESDLRDRAPRLASALYQWCSQRVVLGLDIAAAGPWLDAQLSALAGSDAIVRDLIRSVHLLAAQALLHNEPSSQVVQHTLDRLRGQPSPDYADQRVVSAVLALALASNQGDEIDVWLERALAITSVSEAASIQFELPFLASLGDHVTAQTLDLSARVTARMIHDISWAPPFYSSAPHVLALAVMARKHSKPLASLLLKRLEAMDKIVFTDDQKHRLAFAAPQFEALLDVPGAATLLITLRVSGDGELDPGAYELGPLTGRLAETLQAAAKGPQELPRSRRSAYRQAVVAALNTGEGLVRAVISLGPGVTMSAEQQRFLTQRFEVGWRMARRQLPGLLGAGRLEVVNDHSSAQ